MKKSLFIIAFLMLMTFINIDSIMPGESSHNLNDLDKNFKVKIEYLISKMESEGYKVRIDQTYRSQERQNFLYHFPRAVSKILGLKKLGININVTSTKNSKHSRVKNGIPASCAVDLRPVGLLSIEQKAKFYKDLRNNVIALGMISGGNFEKRKSSPYYKYDLGYDPGHVNILC